MTTVAVVATETDWTDAGTSVIAAPPAGTAVGDVVLAFFTVTAGTSKTLTGAAGFNLLGVVDENGGGERLACYWKEMAVAGDTTASYTFVASSTSNMIVALIAFREALASDPIGASASYAPATSLAVDASVDAPTLTPPRACVHLVCAFSSETNTVWSTPTSMVEQCDLVTTYTSTNCSLAVFTQQLADTSATGIRTSTAATPDSDSPVVWSIYVQPPVSGGFFQFGMNH